LRTCQDIEWGIPVFSMIKFLFFFLLFFPYSVCSQLWILDSLESKSIDNDFVGLKSLLDEQSSLKQNYPAYYHYYLGKYFRSKAKLEDQLNHFYSALEKYPTNLTDSLKAKIFDELAIALDDGGVLDREKAKEYIDASIIIKKKTKNKESLAKSYLIKSNVFYNDWRVGLERSLEDVRLDSCEYYLLEAMKLAQSTSLVSLIENNLATLKHDRGDFENAEKIYLSRLKKFEQEKQSDEIEYLYVQLASLYLTWEKFEKSNFYADSAYVQSKSNKSNLGIVDAFSIKASLAKELGDYEASLVFRDSMDVYDHLYYDELNFEAQEKYNSAFLEAELSKEEARKLRNRLWAILSGAFSFLLALISLGIYRLQKFRKRELEMELNQTRIQSALDATRAEMEGEQKERQIIASELHDQLSSSLTAANIHLSLAKNTDSYNEALEKAENILAEVSNHVRNISHKLVSPSLLKFGLSTALDSLVEQYGSDKFQFYFSTNFNGKRIEQSKENFVFRSCAELINNARKYSNGDSVEVLLEEKDDSINLMVKDNGTEKIEFDHVKTGFGLVNIKDRAEAFGGSFSFDASSEENTVVSISIPL